jgi:hypothetical protein
MAMIGRRSFDKIVIVPSHKNICMLDFIYYPSFFLDANGRAYIFVKALLNTCSSYEILFSRQTYEQSERVNKASCATSLTVRRGEHSIFSAEYLGAG